jgi:hypothetical protein
MPMLPAQGPTGLCQICAINERKPRLIEVPDRRSAEVMRDAEWPLMLQRADKVIEERIPLPPPLRADRAHVAASHRRR